MNKLLDWIVKLEFPFAFDVVGQFNVGNWGRYHLYERVNSDEERFSQSFTSLINAIEVGQTFT